MLRVTGSGYRASASSAHRARPSWAAALPGSLELTVLPQEFEDGLAQWLRQDSAFPDVPDRAEQDEEQRDVEPRCCEAADGTHRQSGGHEGHDDSDSQRPQKGSA
eukprot:GHVU01028152.1.p2 GENE.GHVU01028152.1~~GHVU01028152.1.p2  ORF type:complete len:105 (+),score=10.83 GHVU01028152.1:139-453(+)